MTPLGLLITGVGRGQFSPGPQLKVATKGVIKKRFGMFFI
jgi:hypothetical protein